MLLRTGIRTLDRPARSLVTTLTAQHKAQGKKIAVVGTVTATEWGSGVRESWQLPNFKERQAVLPCSQQSDTCPYHEPDYSNRRTYSISLRYI